VTWTYDGAPGIDTAAARRDAVRVLVGDTDTNDQQATDETIAFFLSQAANDVYSAAALTARSIAGTYARYVDTDFEGVSTKYSQRRDNYYELATRLDRQAKKFGSVGLGVPVAGGISISEIDSVEEDDDRPDPFFRRRQFRNPPELDGEDYDRKIR